MDSEVLQGARRLWLPGDNNLRLIIFLASLARILVKI